MNEHKRKLQETQSRREEEEEEESFRNGEDENDYDSQLAVADLHLEYAN